MIAPCIICGTTFKLVGKIQNLPHQPKVCSKNCFLELLRLPKPPQFTKVPSSYTKTMVRWDDKIWTLRSNYERGMAIYLRENGVPFLYEPYLFYLKGYRGYVPDFFLPYANLFIEVKGLWETGAYAKYRDFKKIYNHYIILIDKDFMKRIECRPKKEIQW